MDKANVIKYIIRYLNDNNYNDIANSLQNESGIILYSNDYILIQNFFKTDIEMTLIKYDLIIQNLIERYSGILYDSLPKEKTFIFISILEIFFQKLYLFYKCIPKEDILIQIQNILQLIYTFKEQDYLNTLNIISLNTIIKDLSSIIFSENKSILLKFFPEIETTHKLHQFLCISYYKIYLTEEDLPNIIYTIYSNLIKVCKYHNTSKIENYNSLFSIINNHQCDINKLIPQKVSLTRNLKKEVINVILSNTGKYFATILSDYNIIIYSIEESDNKNIKIYCVSQFNSGHKNIITSLCWNKSDTIIITSSKDKTIRAFDPVKGKCTKIFSNIHDSQITCVQFILDDTQFVSCGLDYKIILSSFDKENIHYLKVPNITINEVLYSKLKNYIISVSSTINSIFFYDEKLTVKKYEKKVNDVIVSCCISKSDNGRYLLINSSKSSPAIELFDLERLETVGKYFGHRQDRFTIKCSFGGINENFILCGSENAKLYIWSKTSSIPICVNKIHVASVNSAIWPYLNCSDIIITCSDDHTIKCLSNENIEKVYFNLGDKLKTKYITVNHNERKKEEEKKSTDNNNTQRNRRDILLNSVNTIRRLGNLLMFSIDSPENS